MNTELKPTQENIIKTIHKSIDKDIDHIDIDFTKEDK